MAPHRNRAGAVNQGSGALDEVQRDRIHRNNTRSRSPYTLQVRSSAKLPNLTIPRPFPLRVTARSHAIQGRKPECQLDEKSRQTLRNFPHSGERMSFFGKRSGKRNSAIESRARRQIRCFASLDDRKPPSRLFTLYAFR
jgi:hypothetical protein